MQRLGFIAVYPFLWLISILPFRIFYLFSDIVYFFVYYIISYRKKVVTNNLQLAFPEKSKKEIYLIKKKFYHHFCDMFLEMVKSMSISDKELKKRFLVKNPEELQRLQSLNKSHIILLGHYASYEWVNALHFYGLTYEGYGVYKKIKNDYFDNLVKKIRSKHHTTMLVTNEVPKRILRNKKSGILSSYGMIADQAPKKGKSSHFITFFDKEVPAFIGSEVLAKRLDLAISYLHIEKVKRGHYTAEFIQLADHPKQFEDFKITEEYFKLLEEQIREEPQYYLWSHKRWKHAKN
ncbi:lysophospholipid acyltransferase family protein [Mesonia aestuariivivens]|uniref:Lysophospholipid acyltransferase family protein n=1 Tax=Mesonia aestuariivivens TaxID=2796128 RepID=A0ABS6W0N5_9FLAO|nr:lysophospholipid acyltransferase family protein [Mesonia aestuariivivens]MBW2961413.1 lysophospholipid acyltransferase family protein [Mesonia aestuariivivens]